jgi:hypothetical protein
MQRTDFSFGLEEEQQDNDKKIESEKPKDTHSLILNKIIYIQFVIIALLLINIVSTLVEDEGAFIEVKGIEFREGVNDNLILIEIRNVGDVATKLNVMGEIFFDSTEGQKFFPSRYVYTGILAGETEQISLGTTELNSFILRVSISWEGGSTVYSQEVR